MEAIVKKRAEPVFCFIGLAQATLTPVSMIYLIIGIAMFFISFFARTLLQLLLLYF